MDSNYKTTDMGMASYLFYKGFKEFTMENDSTRASRKIFTFKRKQGIKIEDIAYEYQSCKGSVEPREYFESIRAIKNAVYSN